MSDRDVLPDHSGCEACDPPCAPGSLPVDPTERLAVLELLWAQVVERGFARPIPCDEDPEEEGSEHWQTQATEDRGCCEGHGWLWQWAGSPRAVDETEQPK